MRLTVTLSLAAMAGVWELAETRADPPPQQSASSTQGPEIAKTVLRPDQGGANLLRADAWKPYEKGFDRQGTSFACNNGASAAERRGVMQSIALDQTRPEPIVAACQSKAEGVGGTADSDYSLYLDLLYTDGTPLWGQAASFSTGTHDWQRRQLVVLPEKPVKSVSFYLLLRGHAGKAWFRNAELRVIHPPAGACLFDGLPVVPRGPVAGDTTYQLRDVAAGSDFVCLGNPSTGDDERGLSVVYETLGIELREQDTAQTRTKYRTEWSEVRLTDLTHKDRAITLVFAEPVEGKSLRWLMDPRRSEPVEPGREYVSATQFHAGSNGRLSLYPLGAVADDKRGVAVAVAPDWPAFCRIGYNAGTKELYLAYDIALTPERPKAELHSCRFRFDPKSGFRGALARYYELYPEAFRCRVRDQGLWMPFAKISEVPGWQDFGFRIKEGDDEPQWDRAHGVLTFRYTEPMTWWMPMPKAQPRTLEAALAEARRLAASGNREARALFSSGYHDADGRLVARLLDTPWCNGAVWSMNSSPGIPGEVTDFKNKWNPAIRAKLYGPESASGVAGEYVDSSEGYVTDELDSCREHFAASTRPLVFSPDDHRPAVFRGLIAWDYVAGIAGDVHHDGKLAMANGAPTRLWWLAPWLDVLGTETDWNPGGRWRPMSDAELLYRRAICKGKPFCFLMNTRFEDFSHELVEKYMKRCLAYGMFPGFFSADASRGHYFTRPELYNRDRPLFRRYVPLCKRVAEAGWEPVTRARCDDEHVYVERFGAADRGGCYLTVFNDSPERRTVTVACEDAAAAPGRELLRGQTVAWRDGRTTLSLEGEDVAVIELPAAAGAGAEHPRGATR
jgi:hypothetical protein